MPDLVYYGLCGVCVIAVLLGISAMSKVKASVKGNALSALAMVFAIALIIYTRVADAGTAAIIALAAALVVGTVAGIYCAAKAKMIAMPQIIALLNGFGGAASALVAAVTAVNGGANAFEASTAGLALAIAGKVVARELNSADQEQMIDRFIDELGGAV